MRSAPGSRRSNGAVASRGCGDVRRHPAHRCTEVEGGDRRAMFRRLDLTEIAAGAAEAIGEVLADEKGQTLRLGPWAPAPIDGDERLLYPGFVVNLVENAVNHTSPGSILAGVGDAEGRCRRPHRRR